VRRFRLQFFITVIQSPSARFPLPAAITGPGAECTGAGSSVPRFYAADSMAGSQPVPASTPAAWAAMSPFLKVAILSTAAGKHGNTGLRVHDDVEKIRVYRVK
jgi:hypothetical protein